MGQLQSNKAGAVADAADVVHSVDRAELLGTDGPRGRPLDLLLQVSLDPPGSGHRAGAAPADLPPLADAVLASDHLELRGLMAVAPLGEDPVAAFGRLAEVRARFVSAYPSATWLSAGMSGDLEHAVRRVRHTCVSAPRSSDRGLPSSSVPGRWQSQERPSGPEGRHS